MKKIISALLCSAAMLCSVNTYAYNYPSSFWTANTNYDTAVKSNNYGDIVKYGTEIINIMRSMPDSRESRDTIAARSKQVGLAYAAMGDYANSANTFEELYRFASAYEEYEDYAKESKARAIQYKPQITMYTDNGTSPYYGAKNEKPNGVLFGICENGATREKLDNESMVLVYQELGQSLLAYNTSVLGKADSAGLAVEFALNCPNEGNDIRNITGLTSHLQEISDMFKQYPNLPVYLRFGAEFDVWDTPALAEEFISAFRYVAQFFRERNSNVALVWSPNQVPSWTVNRDEYYPGDEYVDWVGMSLYAQPYFRCDKNSAEKDEIIFRTGINSDPVIAVRDIIEKYGNRKPIMISESGCGHKLSLSGEDTSAFALRRLKEYYSYLPMVYPQIKLAAYFDWFTPSDKEKDDYRLSTSSAMQNEYIKITKGERFIHNGFNGSTDFCYRPVSDNLSLNGIFPVSCYAHKYNTELNSVTYFIDDKYVGVSNEIPFTVYVNANEYSGKHTLKAAANFSDGQNLITESSVIINGSGSNINVDISGKKIDFDQQPVIYNGRTLVPMRKIFEELNASVEWDGDTRTAIGTKGNKTIKLTVGSNIMYINDKAVTLDTAPIIMSDRTLVPVRAVAEGLNCNVDWNADTLTVLITPN